MNTQTRTRTTWLKRGEWNFLFLSALCALMLASPSAGASLAASPLAMSSLSSLSSLSSAGAPAQYEAVLRWLQQSTGQASKTSLAHSWGTSHVAVAGVIDTAVPANVEAHDVTALMASLATPSALHSTEIALPPFTEREHQVSRVHTALAQPVDAYNPALVAARYDATRRYVVHSLTAHEASTLSGTCTNRSIE